MKLKITFLSVALLVMLTVAGTASAAPITVPLSDFVIFSGGGVTYDQWDTYETEIGGHVHIIGNIGSNQDLFQQGNPLPGYPAWTEGSVYTGGYLKFGQELTVGSLSQAEELVVNGTNPTAGPGRQEAWILGGSSTVTNIYGDLFVTGQATNTTVDLANVDGVFIHGDIQFWGGGDCVNCDDVGTFPTDRNVEGTVSSPATTRTFAPISMPPATDLTVFTVTQGPQQVPAGPGSLTLAPNTIATGYGALTTSSTGQTINLTSGNYYFESIDTAGGLTLNIDLTSGQPINIYVLNNASFNLTKLMVKGPTMNEYKLISDPNAQSLAGLIYLETQGVFQLGPGGLANDHIIWGGTVYASSRVEGEAFLDIRQYVEWYGAAWSFDKFKTMDHGYWYLVPLDRTPAIGVEKLVSVDNGTNYHEADSPDPGPTVAAGSETVWFKFVVTNTGNVPLTNITLTDPDYQSEIDSDCTIPDSLAAGDSFACEIGPFEALLSLNTNTAMAEGDYNGTTVDASNDANYTGVAPGTPLIHLEKSVSVDNQLNWLPADTAPGPTATIGDDVYFKFEVTNTGDVTLYDVTLGDSVFDFSEGTVSISDGNPSYASGVITFGDELAPGASFVVILNPIEAQVGQHTNMATANGDDTAGEGGTQVSDTNPANYYGGNLTISLEKSVSVDNQQTYHEADTAPGPTATIGADVYFKFVVTNTSNVELTNITLTDPDYPLEIASDCTIPESLAPFGQEGDSFECVIGPFAALEGQQTNTATATGDYEDQTASDHNDANYIGVFAGTPAIDVEKYLRFESSTGPWVDADTAPGETVMAGTDTWFRFVVTNTGNVPLTDITLTDTDFDLSSCEGEIIDPLAPDASFECVIGPFPATGEAHTNTATATGDYDGQSVSDQDSANYAGRFWAFTPGFWKNNSKGKHNAWVYTAYTTGVTLGEVFPEEADCLDEYRLDKKGREMEPFYTYTLLEALSFQGNETISGAMEILLRASVASLLNASFHEKMGNVIDDGGVYPYTTADVILMVEEVLCSGDRDTILTLYESLDALNNGIHYIDWKWPTP